MRYIKWIILILALLFIFMQLHYNVPSFLKPLTLMLRVPGKTFASFSIQLWFAFVLVFFLGFGLAILFEVYYWFKYTQTIRQQNKIIKELKKKIELKPDSKAQ